MNTLYIRIKDIEKSITSLLLWSMFSFLFRYGLKAVELGGLKWCSLQKVLISRPFSALKLFPCQGLLLRQLGTSRLLSQYEIIVVDEVGKNCFSGSCETGHVGP